MTTWNHRVIRKTNGEEVWYGVHEVFFDEGGEPIMCTKEPLGLYHVDDDPIKKLIEDFDRMREALDKPILNYEDIGDEQ